MSLDLESLKRFSQWSVKESVKESLEQSLTQIFFVISPQLKQKGHKSKSEPPFKSSEVGWWHLFHLITSLAKAWLGTSVKYTKLLAPKASEVLVYDISTAAGCSEEIILQRVIPFLLTYCSEHVSLYRQMHSNQSTISSVLHISLMLLSSPAMTPFTCSDILHSSHVMLWGLKRTERLPCLWFESKDFVGLVLTSGIGLCPNSPISPTLTGDCKKLSTGHFSTTGQLFAVNITNEGLGLNFFWMTKYATSNT